MVSTEAQPFEGSTFTSHGSGDQFNAPGGTQNINNGGNQVIGGTYHTPVYFGTKQLDPIQGCLQSLAFIEMYMRAGSIEDAQQGTCDWLFEHEAYKSWISRGRALLWIKGKPGSGKSTLLHHILRRTETSPRTRERAIFLTFFFYGRGATLQKSQMGLFRSLLHQLLSQDPEGSTDLVNTFQKRCETMGKPEEKWEWDLRELRSLCVSFLQNTLKNRPIWLFIDALDECGEENAKNLAIYLRSLFWPGQWQDFHICFTCRHYPNLALDMNEVSEICVEKENDEDISTFVQFKLRSVREPKLSAISALITGRAKGVFLWARLVVKRVLILEEEGAGLEKMKAILNALDMELEELYRHLLQSARPYDEKLTQWVCFAMRPLSLDELRWAMLINSDCSHRSLYECRTKEDFPSEDDIVKQVQTLSRGLAEVVWGASGETIVQLIHQTVKDFLVKEGLETNWEGRAHYELSRTCIRYLKMDEFTPDSGFVYLGNKEDCSSTLLHYAATSWMAHARQSEQSGIVQDDLLECLEWPLETLAERCNRLFVQHEIRSGRRGDVQSVTGMYPPGTTVLHLLSTHHLLGPLQLLLHKASYKQHEVAINAKDHGGRSPLSCAAEKGHEAIVEYLLTAEDSVARWPRTIISLIHKKGAAKIDQKDNSGRTPLAEAASNGHESVVRLLLEKGAKIDHVDHRGFTPLAFAALKGQESVVRLLLEKGAKIDHADHIGYTPLGNAVIMDQESIVRLLLNKGANIDPVDHIG